MITRILIALLASGSAALAAGATLPALPGDAPTVGATATSEFPVEIDAGHVLRELGRIDAARDTGASAVIALPTPGGSEESFRLVAASVMDDSLAQRFPQIRAYRGVSLSRPNVVVRLERHGNKLSAMVFDSDGSWIIGEAMGRYRLIPRGQSMDGPRLACSASAMGIEPTAFAPMPTRLNEGAGRAVGSVLRTYRFAVAATGEFTQTFGGTVAGGLAGVVQAVNRVNEIYENEVGVRLVLVSNNDQLIFVDPLTDPFTNGNVGAMVLQSQTTIDSVIGPSGYDVGHLVGTAGGGGAGTGVVCGPGKAAGVSTDADPTGDPFWVDYFAHELGHQFGAKHTFNGCDGFNSARDADSAFEPGSGSTIMAFAGLCLTQNIQPFSSPYFHVRSLEQMHAFTQQGLGSTCGSTTPTGNSPPSVATSGPWTIPARTPFRLPAVATDPDGDPLTYAIEQFDLGPATANGTEVPIDAGAGPLMRSFPPNGQAVRVIPRLADLLPGTSTLGEALPTTTRTLTFRVTARDNRPGGGGVAWSGTTSPNVPPLVLNVIGTAGPFRVLSQATPVSWTAAAQQILWDPAGTDSAPISCAAVAIRLSTDGGWTFTRDLVVATANDGAETVLVPPINTTAGRVEVSCNGNVFFAVNGADITILGSQFVDPLFADSFEQGVP